MSPEDKEGDTVNLDGDLYVCEWMHGYVGCVEARGQPQVSTTNFIVLTGAGQGMHCSLSWNLPDRFVADLCCPCFSTCHPHPAVLHK